MDFGLAAAILVLGGIVLFHEFGHFLAARLFGVGVVEFSVGFGPRLLSHVSKKSGTRYSLKLFPLGGSCAMMGELEDEETEAGEERLENTGAAGKDTAGELLGGSFLEQSPIARFCIIAAGPVFNFILAYVLAVVILSWAGYDAPVLVGTTEGQPAQEAGMAAGDVITAIEGRSIHFSRDIQLYNLTGDGSPMEVAYKRYEEASGRWEERSTVLTPIEISGQHYFGFQLAGYRQPVESVPRLFLYGVYEVQFWIRSVVDSLKLMAAGRVSGDDIAGPVRIVTIIDETVEQNLSYGFVTVIMNLFNLTVMFSANLGVMNLIPIPALDGGRLLFILIEMIFRRPVNRKIENAMILTGMALLMTFMAVVLWNDIRFLLP
ncbi:MAG TPA: site-2 protease family protein [Candidatus Copromonas avistercoris]|nr:site-2 protease family protein [Candidatus Copromonas avistercoris]